MRPSRRALVVATLVCHGAGVALAQALPPARTASPRDAAASAADGRDRAPLVLPYSSFFNLSEPNYFLFAFENRKEKRVLAPGEDVRQIKFRVALRYRAVSLGNPRHDSGIHAGYTQNSFWHLWEPSAPFFDSNYNPQAFLYLDERDYSSRLPRYLPSLRVFVEHESNGRDGIASRGWNRFGMGGDFGDPNRHMVFATLRGWGTFGVDAEHNPDIREYAGRGEFTMGFQPLISDSVGIGGAGASVKSRLAGRQAFTNVEVNVFFAPAIRALRKRQAPKRVNFSLMLQGFYGYAENLLTYSERHSEFRFGLATVR